MLCIIELLLGRSALATNTRSWRDRRAEDLRQVRIIGQIGRILELEIAFFPLLLLFLFPSEFFLDLALQLRDLFDNRLELLLGSVVLLVDLRLKFLDNDSLFVFLMFKLDNFIDFFLVKLD